MTVSEELFKKFCAQSRIECDHIQTSKTKTPDYKLTIERQQIIVEVKEIDRNRDEIKSLRLLGREEGGGIPGDRVRRKIKNAYPQIKRRTKDVYPSILVLYDITWGGHLDPYEIRVAMYGLEQIHMNVPVNPMISPYATGMSYGPRRKMTKKHNKSISAIGVLSSPRPNEIMFEVYHNKYASVPLDPTLFAKLGIRQFELEEEVSGKTAKWNELVIQN